MYVSTTKNHRLHFKQSFTTKSTFPSYRALCSFDAPLPSCQKSVSPQQITRKREMERYN